MIQQRVTFTREVLELADCIGQFIEYWGFKRIHGKIWTLLFLSKTPLSTQNLIDNLDISKGLMSTSLQTLIDHNLIFVVDGDNKKEKMYTTSLKIAPVIKNVLRHREWELLKVIKQAFAQVSVQTDTNIDKKYLDRLKRYISWGEIILKGVMNFALVDLRNWKNIDSPDLTKVPSKEESLCSDFEH